MSDAAVRRNRMNLLIREQRAVPKRKALMESLRDVGLNLNKLNIVVPPQSDRIREEVIAEFAHLQEMNGLHAEAPADLRSSCTFLEGRFACTPGRWSVMLERGRDIGILEFSSHPSMLQLLCMCSFDKESVWLILNGSFYALLDMVWDDVWNPDAVTCQIYGDKNMQDRIDSPPLSLIGKWGS